MPPRFVNVSLRNVQDAAKYIELLNGGIFKSLDEVLREEYESASASYSRNRDPSAFEPLLAVLADSFEFRETISTAANPIAPSATHSAGGTQWPPRRRRIQQVQGFGQWRLLSAFGDGWV